MVEDKILRCRNCGQEFVFTAGEQEFYQTHGLLYEPNHCHQCRAARRRSRAGTATTTSRQMYPAVCADCGVATQVPFEPVEERPVYCRDCYARHKKAV